jgi:chromosome segregation ATPase
MNQVDGGLLQLEANKSSSARADDHLDGASKQQVVPDNRVLVTCPHCDAILTVRRIHAGSGVRCKRCTQKFLMPTTLCGPPNKVYDGSINNATTGSNHIDVQNDGTGTAKDRLMVQLAQFVASNDELQLAHHRLRSEHNDLLQERQSIRTSLQETSRELTAIRTALGTIATDTSPSVAVEALRTEVQALRDQNKKLLDDHTDAKRLISTLEGKVREFLPLPEERDALLEQVKDRDLELRAIRAVRDSLLKNLMEEKAAVVEKDGEIVHLKKQLAESENNTSTSTEACLEAQQRLDRSEVTLREVRADVVRLTDERSNALATIEQSQRASAEREHAIEIQVATLTAELESSQAALCSSEQARHEEVGTLEAEVNSLKKEHERLVVERESARALFAELQESNSELSRAQEHLAATYRQQLEREQHEREKLASELIDLRAEYTETIRVAEERISAALDVPTVPFASAEELEDANISAEALRRHNFAESDYLARLMAETLESGGIVVGVPSKRSNNAAPVNGAAH